MLTRSSSIESASVKIDSPTALAVKPPSGVSSPRNTISITTFAAVDGGDEFAGILGQKVDFCSRLDPRLEPTVRREAVTIYEDSWAVGARVQGGTCLENG
jgi:hypothetical protein